MSEREREPGHRNYWEELFRMRDEFREQAKTAVKVVKGKDLPWERNRQGLMRWYLHPAIRDTVIRTLMMFVQEIPAGSRSGRIKFQGGQVIYIIDGKGHTILDGVRYDWEAGDVLNLPLRRDGIVVQHFNDDLQNPARYIAAEVNTVDMMGVDKGSGFEQLETAPEYTS